jgi:cystathionine beta-synthase
MLDRPDVIRVEEVLGAKGGDLPSLITVDAHDKVRQAVDTLQLHGISQAPVVREGDGSDVSRFVGSIRDRELLERVFRDPDALQADVAEVMAPPVPIVEWDDAVEVVFSVLEQAPAALVSKEGQVLGVVTRSDLLEFLAHRRRQS